MALEVVPYEERWLPQLAALARAHARLVLPGISLADEDVERGLTRHTAWPFYTPGLRGGQLLLATSGEDLLAAGQAGMVETGWGYGAAPGDGPDWVHETHLSLYWLFAWPGWDAAREGAAAVATTVVSQARRQGLPGVEAFRGGPGFLPFGTQLSRRWPHLWAPLRAAGFRQPRDLLAFTGSTDPAALPALPEPPAGLALRERRGRLEAWLDGEPVGVCAAAPLGAPWGWQRGESGAPFADSRLGEWATIRRLAVERSLRERGIGSALFAGALEGLHRRGFTHYLLHIPDDPEDLPAVRLYSRFGRLADVQQVLRVSF